MSQRIYFDESGFTGNNLLHLDQRFFCYASVATDDHEAMVFVQRLVQKYGIQGGELKGRNLVRHNKGRKAIDEILEHYEGRVKISISDKKFALACKFFEYIFEPCISEISSLFYGVGFHRFIANILYIEFLAKGAGAEQIFNEFEELMRTKDEGKLQGLFSSSIHPENSPILTYIREFALWRANDIRKELASLGGDGAGKWILDLTNTALFTLLANWRTDFAEITAVCDFSQPLQHEHSIFDGMIGIKKQVFIDTYRGKHPLTFNLSGPVQFMDSKSTHGIQIADAIAAAAVHVFSGAENEHARKWRPLLACIGHYGSVIPDPDELDLKTIVAQRNSLLLLELHSRAKNGASLIEGMPEYVDLVTRMLAMPRGPGHPPSQGVVGARNPRGGHGTGIMRKRKTKK